MSDSAQAPSAAASKNVTASKASKSPAIVGAVGVLLVLAAAGTVAIKSNLGFDGIAAGQTTVTSVPHDLDAAAGTLTQSVAGGLVDDAKRCRVPLVSMTIDEGTARVG